jgi:UDP-2,3-diacylglucosamine hydrolase
MAPAAPPAVHELQAPPAWQAIEFISDLHLSELTPRSFEAWRDYLHGTGADAVFMLGDLFEVWVGDDAAEDPGTFEARCLDVLTAAARLRPLYFMAGNRDFLLGAAAFERSGVVALPDPTVLSSWGRRILLSHGDAWCLSDTAYQAFRRQVRTDAWRDRFLAQPLPARRAQARAMRDASEALKRDQAPASWSDVDRATAIDRLTATGASDLVHGHTHRPATESIAPGLTRHVLSDWDLDAPVRRAEVLRLGPDGFSRRSP